MTKTELAKKLLRRVFIKAGREEYYEIDGKKDGEYKMWYENGRPFIHCFYKNGKCDGEYKMQYENGQLAEHCCFTNGELDGEFKSWNRNGQLDIHRHYKDGVEIK